MTVPKLLQDDVECVSGKRERFDWTIRLEDENGNRRGLEEADKVIFRLAATANGQALLEFNSDEPSNNESQITIVTLGSSTVDASGTLTLQAEDTADYAASAKHYELNVTDSGDGNKESQPIRGKMKFLPSISTP